MRRDRLYARTGSLGEITLIKPRKHNIWQRLMEQIGACRAEEEALLDEIDAIERKHRQLRQQKKLKPVTANLNAKPAKDDEKHEAKRENRLISTLMILWAWTDHFPRPEKS